jgi:aminomethyltransferase
MVEFAGYQMPIQYPNGTIAAHIQTRTNCGLFDVSHMGQLEFSGEDHLDFLEYLVPGNIKDLTDGSARLTQLTNEKGGIIDDTIITKFNNYTYNVINAGCFDGDMEHFKKHLKEWNQKGKSVKMVHLKDYSLLALQGPKAVNVLKKFAPNTDFANFFFMTSRMISLGTTDCQVSRLGYTGEDGFEIRVHNDDVEKLAKEFISNEHVQLIGLGARDTLRLEAGLCLMGHDMKPDISPIEANLNFTIGKRRKDEGNFLGAETILKHLNQGTSIKRILFQIEGKLSSREGQKIFSESGEEIGYVTSGCPSPTLKKSIGMGYVKTDLSKKGTPIKVEIRNQKIDGSIVVGSHVPTNYYTPKVAVKSDPLKLYDSIRLPTQTL